MNNEIIFISTTDGVTKKIRMVLEERNLDYPIYEATTARACEIAKKSIEAGTKIIVCRGGTTDYLRKRVDVPVVDIRHGFIDIHLSVEKARKISDKIGFIGYSNLCDAAREYSKIMNREIQIAMVNCDEEIEKRLLDFIDEGIEVVIGGFQLAKAAEKYDVTQIMGESDSAAIDQSINEALHDLKIEHERQERYETINSILNCTSEGIIGVGVDGHIIHINDNAKELLDYEDQENIEDLLVGSDILVTCEKGEAHFNEFLNIGGNQIVVNSVPIKIEEKVIGAVATIQEQNAIMSVDFEIRKKLLGTGHVAKNTFKDIVGESTELNEVINRASKYSKTDSTILIMGETGTGKEIFAQSIHNHSRRKNQPFVAINCAALPENILESELFGYAKGAFTGARAEGKPGIFELAHLGTVFLDEIGEISTSVQAKLLRVLQEKEVTRIGDDKVIPVDVRILAATNKNLVEEISEGEFREDLYFRICTLELEIPPLRERKGDVKDLVNHFIKEKSNEPMEVPEDVMEMFMEYDWPGNVRQLANVIERLVVIGGNGTIDYETASEALKNIYLRKGKHVVKKGTAASEKEGQLINIIDKLLSGINPVEKGFDLEGEGDFVINRREALSLKEGEDLNLHLMNYEKKIIKNTLDKFHGNREETAELLGISSATLWRKLKKMDLL